MIKSNGKFLLLSGFLCAMIACTSENNLPQNLSEPQLPEVAYDYKSVMAEVQDFTLPEVLLQSEFNPSGNIIDCQFCDPSFFNGPSSQITSDEKATIGRVLFYDKLMSKNNSISCASCHKQELAFADGAKVSEGFGGKLTERNSGSIVNPIVSQNFFWDSRSSSLEDLALRPVQNHIEMGMESIEELTQKLSQEGYYKDLFKKAYGSENVTSSRVAESLSEFIASMFKKDSKFDEGLVSNFDNFSSLEKHGMELFFSSTTQCASCHAGANFSTPTGGFNNPYRDTGGSTNIGLDVVYEDQGFADGKFKIPSLRNIALTAPYMHDGRFETLTEVIQHYNTGIQPHEFNWRCSYSNGID